MYCLSRFACLLVVCTLSALSVRADTVTYTFDGPRFSVGQIAPLHNQTPNSGPDTFQASFVSSLPATFRIANVQPNVLFSGQSLFNPSTPSVLTISFNIAVTEVQFVFALESPGLLTLMSSEGTLSQNSAMVGGSFQGGIFTFTSATPFTMFTLASFNLAGAPTRFAIDNLTLQAVPEPTSLLIFGTGLAAMVRQFKRLKSDSLV